jgi:hypothetical protein
MQNVKASANVEDKEQLLPRTYQRQPVVSALTQGNTICLRKLILPAMTKNQSRSEKKVPR